MHACTLCYRCIVCRSWSQTISWNGAYLLEITRPITRGAYNKPPIVSRDQLVTPCMHIQIIKGRAV